MRDELLPLLADPADRSPLSLSDEQRDAGGDIISGTLRGGSGRAFGIVRAIPRFVMTEDAGQQQTQESFGYKWAQQQSYGSEGMLSRSREWLVSRYGFDSAEAMSAYMARAGRVLDAGCGSAFSASLWLSPEWGGSMWVGADISTAIDVARSRLSSIPNTHFVQGDVLELPFREEVFDVIFSEGVLHHTPSTERAFKALVPLVRPGGEIMAYIYRKKSPLREFTDDYIREQVASMPPAEAWEHMRSLTALGQALAETKASVTVTEDVPLLGIPKGSHDIQRLIYWHFAKLFWNDDYTFEENHHINFDWYHPRYAHRHTEEELRAWCADTGLVVRHLDVQQSGFTVRATRS